jgi:AraC family ethanolamine operon transcriptional activator
VVGIPVVLKGSALFSRQVLTRDSMLTFHSDQEFSLVVPEGFDVVAVAIPEQTLMEAMQPNSTDEFEKLFPKSPSVMVAPPGQLDDLRKCLLSIFDPGSFEPELLAYPQVQKAMSSAIIGHLAEVLGSATQAPMPTRSFKGRCQVVKAATEYAMDHLTEPVTVNDLCLQLNISRRMLNYCFQDALATNPVQYLRSLRLNGVRRELRHIGETPASIRDIACKWGFWHLPRFASEYKALFGELPSETARILRTG